MQTENETFRVVKQRISFVMSEPFFGQLLLNLKLVEMDEDTIKSLESSGRYPTFCTNGVHLWFNPDFSKRLNEVQLRTVLLHEVLHPMLLHIFRVGNRDPVLFNIACDYLVNNMIMRYVEHNTKAGKPVYFCPLTGIPVNPSKNFDWVQDYKYEGMSAESVYDELVKTYKKPNKTYLIGEFTSDGGGKLKDKDGNVIGELTPEEMKDLEEQWKNNIVQASIAAKQQGKMPGTLEKLIDTLLEPKIYWQDVLRRFISQSAKSEYNWMRPNKRMLAHGMYYPSMHSEVLGHIAMIIDSSGSTWPILDEFVSEVQAVVDFCRPEKLSLLEVDDALQQVQEYFPGDLIEFKIKGSGGTSFIPGFNHVNKMDDKPVCVVYLTDGEGAFPTEAPDYPVLWIIKNSPATQIPFGEVIYI